MVPVAYVVAALINVLFVKALAVRLPLDTFGAVIATLTLMLAATFAALTLQALAASAASARVKRGLRPGFSRRSDRLANRVTGVAIALAVIGYCVPSLTHALRLPSPSYTAALPLLAATAILNAVATGTVLGSGRDRAFVFVVLLEPLLRCALAWLFMGRLGMGGFGAVLAMLFSTTLNFAVSRGRLLGAAEEDGVLSARERLARHRLPLQPFSSVPALLALFCFGVLVFLDIPVARFLLDAEEGGVYSGMATASRFLLLLPFPLALLLAARVKSRLIRREATLPELLRMLAIFAIPAALCLWLVSEFATPILSLLLDRDKFAVAAREFPRYAIATTLFGAAELLLFYGIAAGRVSLATLPIAAAVLEVVLLADKGTSIGNCVSVVQTMAILFGLALAAVVLTPLSRARGL